MLVERRRELDLLWDAFAGSTGGRGRFVLISGGLASGKTELLHAFSEQVTERGAVLLTATAARAEQGLRMGVVWQLCQGPHVPPELLDRMSLLTGGSNTGEPDAAAARQAAARTAHAVCAMLLELAEQRPVVIAVDDVQFADSASLEMLRYLRCRMRSAKLLMVLTEWERPHLTRPPLRAEVTRQPYRRITLGPLSAAGVAELISRRLDTDSGARLARGCYALGGGNPFLTNALIEDQAHRPAPQSPGGVDTPTVGAAFREAVLDCLHRWDPEFMRVAGGTAVLGEHATEELVGELVGVQPRTVGQVFEVLAGAGLASGGRLRHPEIVATVLESLTPQDRSTLHGRAAELLYRDGVDALEVSRQVTAVDQVPGPWAVPLLRHAAEQSLAEDAGLAVRYLELAIRACEDGRERVALRAAAVRAAWRVNPSAAALHLAPLGEALAAGELSWRDALPVIRHQLWQGDLATAAEQLRAMHAAAGPADPRSAAELRLAGEWIYGRLLDRLPEDVRSWLAAPEPTGSFPWRRTATLDTLWTGEDSDVVSAAEHVLQGCLGDIVPEVGATAVLALDYTGRHKRARYWCETLFEEAERQHATTWQAVFGCVRAELALRRGDLLTAREQATLALGLLHTQSWGVLIGLPLSVLVRVETALGRPEDAAELLDRAVPEAMFDTVAGARYLHASGHYHLACGRPLAAIEDFERCGGAMRRWGFDLPAMVPWRGDLAQAYLELGMRREARALVIEQLGRPRSTIGPRARAVSLRTLAGCAEPAERVRILREAVQIFERCSSRLELAHALTDLSHAHRELGDLSNAQLVLRRADQIAKACHHGVTAAQPRRQSDLAVRRPTDRVAQGIGVSALSGAEQKVAELAANGHSNREIGRKLSITVSTVEQHLTRVYRKLNVSRRTDLLSELSRPDAIDRTPAADQPRVLVPR